MWLATVRHLPHSIDDLLAAARARLDRLEPAAARAAAEAGAMLVDIRPLDQRARDGDVPGAVVVGRNVLEWRLDPASAHRLPDGPRYDQPVVVLCNQGYQSSLAAASLQDLGLTWATDVIGGFEAWRVAGLPIVPYRGPTAEEGGGRGPGYEEPRKSVSRAANSTGRSP
jgi:rhodanese-related sulfurtransferase